MFQLDEKLILQLVKKNKKSYEIFYNKTIDTFFRYIKGHYFVSDADAEDILSDFYVKFWRVVSKYDDTYKFESYIWTVLKSVIYDALRKNKNTYMVDSASLELMDWKEKDVLEFMEEDFQQSQIDEAMKKLKDHEREILFWRFTEEKSYEELQDIFDLSLDLLRQRTFRAIKKLKSLISHNI